MDQRGAEERGEAVIEPPPVDPHAAIKTELWRWHLGRVFVHEFSKLARRIRPEPPPQKRRRTDDTGDGRARWQRTKPKPPQMGLAAFKHAQQQEQRAATVRDFRAAESTADQASGAARDLKREGTTAVRPSDFDSMDFRPSHRRIA